MHTFRNSILIYRFSDHKKAELDIAGELYIAGNGEAQLKFTRIAWEDVYLSEIFEVLFSFNK